MKNRVYMGTGADEMYIRRKICGQENMVQRRGTTLDLAVCGLFAALIAAGAFMRITIPVQPFPMHFTLQWFFVLLAGLLLKPKQAFTSVVTYLVTGLLGVPVFAAGGGPAYLIRPTFGFLLGFALAAYGMACLMKRLRFRKWISMMVAATAGLLLYYAAGMVYFYGISNFVISMPVGWKVVLINCCLITIGEDFLLCVLAVMVAGRLRPVVHRYL